MTGVRRAEPHEADAAESLMRHSPEGPRILCGMQIASVRLTLARAERLCEELIERRGIPNDVRINARRLLAEIRLDAIPFRLFASPTQLAPAVPEKSEGDPSP